MLFKARKRLGYGSKADLSGDFEGCQGGGGRGICVVQAEKDFAASFEQSRKRESLSAFGSTDVFIEKFIGKASHIEVQPPGDKHGNFCSLVRT
ncbi:MAG: hypothetical protein U0894_15095 [Pirellulales bacterium]